jgi:outer membrane protein assembly factor BamE
VLVLFLAACSATGIPGITPYKINVQQGNVVTQDMLTKLKRGMTRSQVRYVMGTPLITDPFHPDRWDYVYSFSKHGGKPQERRITVVFNNDRLAHIEGDVVPQKESAAKSETPENAGTEAASSNVTSAPAAAAAAPMPEGASSPASASESSGLPAEASSPTPQGTSTSMPQQTSPSVPPRNISPPEPAPAAAGLPATPGAKPLPSTPAGLKPSTPAGLKPIMPVAPPMGAPTDAQTLYPGAGGVPGAANNPPPAQ